MKRLIVVGMLLLCVCGCTWIASFSQNKVINDLKDARSEVQKKHDELAADFEIFKLKVANAFPWSLFWGFLVLGCIATAVTFAVPFTRCFTGVTAYIFVATLSIVCMSAVIWKIIGAFIAIIILCCILYVVSRTRAFKDLVNRVQDARDSDPDFKAKTDAFKGVLRTETEEAIKNVKTKRASNGQPDSTPTR